MQKVLNKDSLFMLHAYLASDGSVYYDRGGHYEIRFYSEDYAILNLFNKLFYNTFNIKMKEMHYAKSKLGCFGLRLSNKMIYTFLTETFGSFGSTAWKMPTQLLKTKTSKALWIKCYFDAEAYINAANKIIQVKSVNKNGLSSVLHCLSEMGIKSKLYGPYKQRSSFQNDYFVLTISGIQNLKNYLALVSFNSKIKSRKLECVIAGIA